MYCSASEASSSSRSADWPETLPRLNCSDSTSRADAAPIALVSKCSLNRSTPTSASAFGMSGAPREISYSANERSARSVPRYRETVCLSSPTVTAVRHKREAAGMGGVLGGSAAPKICACIRSIGSGARNSDTNT